jgi:hypothetical protein
MEPLQSGWKEGIISIHALVLGKLIRLGGYENISVTYIKSSHVRILMKTMWCWNPAPFWTDMAKILDFHNQYPWIWHILPLASTYSCLGFVIIRICFSLILLIENAFKDMRIDDISHLGCPCAESSLAPHFWTISRTFFLRCGPNN